MRRGVRQPAGAGSFPHHRVGPRKPFMPWSPWPSWAGAAVPAMWRGCWLVHAVTAMGGPARRAVRRRMAAVPGRTSGLFRCAMHRPRDRCDHGRPGCGADGPRVPRRAGPGATLRAASGRVAPGSVARDSVAQGCAANGRAARRLVVPSPGSTPGTKQK